MKIIPVGFLKDLMVNNGACQMIFKCFSEDLDSSDFCLFYSCELGINSGGISGINTNQGEKELQNMFW